jgi:hypothetical protein
MICNRALITVRHPPSHKATAATFPLLHDMFLRMRTPEARYKSTAYTYSSQVKDPAVSSNIILRTR